MKVKNKTIIVVVLATSVLFAMITAYFCERPLDTEIRGAISNYLYIRYDEVSEANLEERYELQNSFYSNKLMDDMSWVNMPQNIESAKEYFTKNHYHSNVLSLIIESDSTNKYTAKAFVLYTSFHSELDNLVTYEFEFVVTKEASEVVFDGIEVIKNQLEYINGGQLHLHNGEVMICHEESPSHIH